MWSLLLHPRSLNSKNAIAAASRSCIFAQFIIAFNLRNESRVTGMSALPSSHLLWVNPPFLCAQGCCYVYAVFTVHRGYYTQSLLYTRITIHSLYYTRELLYTVFSIHCTLWGTYTVGDSRLFICRGEYKYNTQYTVGSVHIQWILSSAPFLPMMPMMLLKLFKSQFLQFFISVNPSSCKQHWWNTSWNLSC